jgi:SAM-dependent methyltransferase
MRTYTAEQYRRLVEETTDSRLQLFMERELAFLARVPGIGGRTVVDLGAGHGRVLADLSALAANVIAVEINPDMYAGLATRAASFPNVQAIQGDALELGDLLEGETVTDPVFLILQNSLGTIEGDHRELLRVVGSQMESRGGELVLSLLRQPSLGGWGVEMYRAISEMIGDPDLTATDVDRGVFTTTTGYTSKWWSDPEIDALKGMGSVEDELVADDFHLVRLGLARQRVAA